MSMFLPEKVFWSPQYLNLDVTRQCNLKCIMCPWQAERGENPPVLSFLKFLAIMKNYSPKVVDLAASGEVLTHRYCGEMVKYLHERSIQSVISTNGVLLGSVGDWIRQLSLIKVSLDAANETTYRAIRGNMHFQEILDNIRVLVRLKMCPVRIEYVITSLNYTEISDFVRLAKELHVDGAFFRMYHGSKVPQDVDDMLRKVPNLSSELKRANTVAKQLKVQSNLPDLCKKLDFVTNQYSLQEIKDDRRQHICLMPWLHMFIRIDGEASPCCDLSEACNVKVGNIFNDPYVWNSAKMRKLRGQFKRHENYNLYSMCRTCEVFDFNQLFNWRKMYPKWLRG